ncbi:Uncharacterized protein TCM_022143 [Theobroma cacao]|uniref:RNase H type-1 domain-containing protein n=1 Tax=Theobroma cacao TaxID=3641 RepID=A0A061ESL6_THECC|nr:Uncharacterized protein TCM_022143 [Theobroma cacao]
MVKLQVAWWAHAKWPNMNVSVSELSRKPNIGLQPKKIKTAKSDGIWQLSSKGMVKFNVDVEILAIKKAFQMVAASRWATTNCVIVESDSENAVKWANEPTTAPWKHKTTTMLLEFFKTQLKGWNFLKIPRAVNGAAIYLAKAIVERNDEFLWVLAYDGEDYTIPHEMLEH